MRHGKKVNHLSRKSAHRKAMLSNMATSLIMHKRIKTTIAKAKALRVYVEPLITRGKSNTTHNRRMCFKYLQNKYSVTEIFEVIAPKVGERPGGYTRIIRIGNRLGDNAEMAIIELVDFNETYSSSKSTKGSGKKRRRRKSSSAKKAAAAATVAAVAEEVSTEAKTDVVEDAVVEEVIEEEVIIKEEVVEGIDPEFERLKAQANDEEE